MKTLEQIEAALDVPYDGEILTDYEGFKYIPWHLAAKQANKIFGYGGWSDEIVYNESVGDAGYRAKSRVTVFYAKEDGSVGTIIHEGEGFNSSNSGRMDTSIMGAPSIAFSKALKKFGDAFGLFLYEKEKEGGQTDRSNGSARRSSRSTTSASSSAARPVGSLKQRSMLLERGLGEHVLKNFDAAGDYDKFKKLCDLVFGSKLSVEDALDKIGWGVTASVGSSEYPELDY